MTEADQPPEQRLQELLGQLAELGFCLPGSLSTRKLRCGNPRCRCRADPPKLHGPYTYWTRKVGGRTVAQLLSAEQLEHYRPWIENDRRLRQLVAQLEALAIQTAQDAEDGRAHRDRQARSGAPADPAARGRRPLKPWPGRQPAHKHPAKPQT